MGKIWKSCSLKQVAVVRIFWILIGLLLSIPCAVADGKWQIFRDTDGLLSVDVPRAVHVERSVKSIPKSMTVAETSNLTVMMANYRYSFDSTRCTISELDFAGAPLPTNMAELQSKQFRDNYSMLGLKFATDAPTTLDGIIGWEQSLKDPDGFVLTVRRFLIKNKLFGVECRLAPDATPEQAAENRRVSDSFHLTP